MGAWETSPPGGWYRRRGGGCMSVGGLRSLKPASLSTTHPRQFQHGLVPVSHPLLPHHPLLGVIPQLVRRRARHPVVAAGLLLARDVEPLGAEVLQAAVDLPAVAAEQRQRLVA